jgi:hypothetical protein
MRRPWVAGRFLLAQRRRPARFLLTAYAKGHQEDLPRDRVNRMRAFVKAIVDEYRRGSRRVR